MRAARLPSLTGLSLAIALSVVACTGGTTPDWTYAPATPAPPSQAPTAGTSSAPSDGGQVVMLELTAQNIQYDKTDLEAPADQPFQISFANNDAGVPHNVEIKNANGGSVFKGEIFNGVDTRTYDVPALAAGTYTFVCTVHPNMTGTLVVK